MRVVAGMMDWDSWVSAKLAALAVSKRQRSLRPFGPIEGSAVSVIMRPRILGQMLADEPSTGEVASPSADAPATALTVFASNDYVGLATTARYVPQHLAPPPPTDADHAHLHSSAGTRRSTERSRQRSRSSKGRRRLYSSRRATLRI